MCFTGLESSPRDTIMSATTSTDTATAPKPALSDADFIASMLGTQKASGVGRITIPVPPAVANANRSQPGSEDDAP